MACLSNGNLASRSSSELRQSAIFNVRERELGRGKGKGKGEGRIGNGERRNL